MNLSTLKLICRKMTYPWVFTCLSFFSLALNAQEVAVTVKGLSVKGNSELPKVLYVVPWQASYGHFLDEEKELTEIHGSFDYAEPEQDKKLRYFRDKLTVEIQPFSQY